MVVELKARLSLQQEMNDKAAAAQLRANEMAEEALAASAAQVSRLQTQIRQGTSADCIFRSKIVE